MPLLIGGSAAKLSEVAKKALELHAAGQISAAELDTLVKKDQEFQAQMRETLADDERFTMSLAFGESWDEKKRRIRRESPEGHRSGWDLVGLIIKSNDDLRQEVCALQLIELSRHLFDQASLPLFLRSYRIISTDASTGLIEVLTDAISIDALKKRQLQRAVSGEVSGSGSGGGGGGGDLDGGGGSIGSLNRHFVTTYVDRLINQSVLSQRRLTIMTSLFFFPGTERTRSGAAKRGGDSPRPSPPTRSSPTYLPSRYYAINE